MKSSSLLWCLFAYGSLWAWAWALPALLLALTTEGSLISKEHIHFCVTNFCQASNLLFPILQRRPKRVSSGYRRSSQVLPSVPVVCMGGQTRLADKTTASGPAAVTRYHVISVHAIIATPRTFECMQLFMQLFMQLRIYMIDDSKSSSRQSGQCHLTLWPDTSAVL